MAVEVTEILGAPPHAHRFVVAQALAKGDRSELAVETMTELGVDEILAWQASRSIVRWQGERGTKSLGPADHMLVDGVPRRRIDTAPYAPKGIVVAESAAPDGKPQLPPEQAIIYEAGVTQLTGHPSAARLADLLAGEPGFEGVTDIPAQYQGTYKGAGLLAPYLKAAGVTTIELLPVHETNASETGRAGATNAWGYMTLSFFAPNRRYAADKSWGGPTREFKEMVRAFHDAGMEVYLDVVYNHTAEGGNWNGDVNTTGFTSLGGFATAEYYQMTRDKILVDGATGTSNQINYSSPMARRLVLDSLHYWSHDMGVDGFRFDLATVLGRSPRDAEPDDWGAQKRFFNEHPLLTGIASLAEKENLEVIAEAWDLWGYEVGNFPRGWGEWNGRYRDAVRRFTKGDGNTTDFLDMVNGDYHHFEDNGGPQKSINFIVAHDGFNLADLVSYQTKDNNQPYPFGPSDGGSDDNMSWDSGGDPGLRRQRLRNLWVILMLSRGVPMVVAGDEFGRTQNGNNNPWALDSPAMRNNYAMIATSAPQRVAVEDGTGAAYHDNLGVFDSRDERVNPLFRFATFLDHELAPTLAAKYPVNPKEQALFGHSFGALFGLYSLFTAPNRFKHNLLASPSVWWHNRRVLDFLPSALPADTAVRISVGEHEGRSNRPEQIGREMVAQAKLLAGTLQHLGADAQFTLYPNANHGNTPFYALPDHIEYLRQAWQKK